MLRREMKTRTSPLLHVHVDETTPVHVHVKKSPKQVKKVQKLKGALECGNLRPTSKVKTKVPWIPPGKTSVREVGYKWEGPTHRLDITPVNTEKLHSTLHLSDLSTDDEEAIHGKMNQYEKKINCLMKQVGSLKSEVELRKKNHLLEQREEELNLSKRLIEEKEEELAEVTKELVLIEHKNELLQRNIEMMKEDPENSCSEKKHWRKDDTLLKKLIEAEMDGAAAAKQAASLRNTISRLGTEKQMSTSECNLLSRQKELLIQKLETFESSNRAVRELLKEQHAQETDALRLFDLKEALLEKLARSEAENAHLLVKMQEIENQTDQLLAQYQTEKDNARAAAEFSKSLESTRAHLQGQLRSKEAENNRLAVQIRNFERTISQQKGQLDYLTEQLRLFQKKGDRDKEALKKATKAQKLRAERSEDAVELLNAQLVDKETQLADALSSAETWRSCHNKVMKEKSQLEIEISILNNRITDLLDQTHHMEDKARGDLESLMDRLHKMSSESTSIKLENETMKANMNALEEKFTFAQTEMQQLKVSIKHYEGLVESYKSQVMKTRMEADEYNMKLEKAERENKLLKDEVNKEIEQVRRQMQKKLSDLEPVPELLKLTEHKLQDCQQQLVMYEKKNVDQSSIICDLRMEIEELGGRTREKYHSMQEENHNLKLKLETLERKLEDVNTHNRELTLVVAQREETIHQNQQRLEEKSRECTSLARQLETAIEDARRQVDQTRERASSKERTAQSKILDLEAQLSRTKTELTQLRRSKDDAERRFQSRLEDLKDRLEQSECTNRSMHNYVQFLKSSYANVFGETALTSSPV
ncbi:outer dense fiber protein 2 isoform X2 [Pristis pectinata]|uniref:outer dense fiber protein 2 isoform X2 n=1 Tax=Pristis pectinata TaxID=685728 RepID=UPI00223CAC81|nr:outer dense fiber protein 2 isoform X2 [Pristis pectinata]